MAENIKVYRGISYNKTFVAIDSSGAVVNITGFTPTAEVRAHGRSSPLVLNLSPTLGTTPANGEIDIALLPADTDVEGGEYTWDLLLSDGTNKLRIAGGTFTVEETTTRS
jgi:hypothetical protein|tara:strand:+ start:78 stop:407 length:330 start_codon:yes stop_codon:yes gene_type:complete